MFAEIERFSKWLRCRSPRAATYCHYTSDVKLFFAWADKPPDAINLHDVDAYIVHCRDSGHAAATVNRRLPFAPSTVFSTSRSSTLRPTLSCPGVTPSAEAALIAIEATLRVLGCPGSQHHNGSFAGIVSVV